MTSPFLHDAMRAQGKQIRQVQRMIQSSGSQLTAFKKDGLYTPSMQVAEIYLTDLRAQERALLRELVQMVDPDHPLARFIRETVGHGSAIYVPLAQQPCSPGEFKHPGNMKSYNGLHRDGAWPAVKGKKDGFSRRLKAAWIHRVAEPHLKLAGPTENCPARRMSPYRPVYDRRITHTLETHPPMFREGTGDCDFCAQAYERSQKVRLGHEYERERKSVGVDCMAMGGVHWCKGRRHADALRVIAQQIIVDLWRVDRGQTARYGIASPVTNEDNQNRPGDAADTGLAISKRDKDSH